MSRISVFVDGPSSQSSRQVQVQEDLPLSIVLTNLVAELGLAERDAHGPVSYILEWQGQLLTEHDTLQARGVKSNDRIQIRSQRVGSPATPVHAPLRVKEGFTYLPRPHAVADESPQGLATLLVVLPSPERTAPTPVVPPPVVPPPVVPPPPPVVPPPVVPPPPPAPTRTTAPPPRQRVDWVVWARAIFLGLVVLAAVFFLGRQNGAGDQQVPQAPVVTVVTAPPEPGASQAQQPAVTVVTVVTVISERPTAAPVATSSGVVAVPTTGRRPTSVPDITVPRPPIIPRSGWGAAPATGRSGSQTPSMLVLTHDGQVLDSSENVLAKLRSVQGVHQRRGWPDIAWHYIIDGEGNIYEGRNPDDRSNTGYDFDTNGMLVVGVLGDYDTQVPNQAQREAVVALMAWLAQEYSIGVDQIYAHSYFANQSPRTNPKITSPGRNFNVSEIQRQVEARLEGRN